MKTDLIQPVLTERVKSLLAIAVASCLGAIIGVTAVIWFFNK